MENSIVKRVKGGTILLLCIYLAFAVFFDDGNGKGTALTDRSLANSVEAEKEFNLNRDTRSSTRTGRSLFDKGEDSNKSDLSAWIVIYDHFARNERETEQQMLSYEMFHNREVYQKILYVWDSSQADDLHFLTKYIPEKLRDDIITLDLNTEMNVVDIKGDFASSSANLANNCFRRGKGYCEMLYIKMNIDEAVKAAATKYGLVVPKIIGIADGDAYWQTMPVKENVVDPAGRVIFHTIQCGNIGGFAPGVEGMLHNGGSFLNGMAFFPMHLWMDTLPLMRQKIIDIAREESGDGSPETFHNAYARKMELASEEHSRSLLHEDQAMAAGESPAPSFADIYVQNTSPVCEFCVMATYASTFEPDRYKFTQAPCPTQHGAVAETNAFLDGTVDALDPLPMVTLMKHEKAGQNLTHPFWPNTLSMWVYGCCITYSITPEEAPMCSGKSADGYRELTGYMHFYHPQGGFTSPTMLKDHFERVYASLDRRPLYENLESKATCLRHLEAIADEYSQCTKCT